MYSANSLMNLVPLNLLLSGFLLFASMCCPAETFAIDKPRQLKAGYIAKNNRLSIVWNKVTGAKRYAVAVKDQKGRTIIKDESISPKIKFKVAKLAANAKYRTVVSAKTAGGSISKSSAVDYYHMRSRFSGEGRLLTKTSGNRSGYYFLPPDFENKAKPLLVAFHGVGASGQAMVSAFRDVAKEFGIIIIAPDSGVHDGLVTWNVGTSPDSFTDDFFHIEKCVAEVLAFNNLVVDSAHVLSAGHSAGGYTAPYYATNKSEFTGFAVLHGGFFSGGFGRRMMPAWLSTGLQDTLAPPQAMQVSSVRLQERGFTDVTLATFDVGHGLNSPEVRALMEWWLK